MADPATAALITADPVNAPGTRPATGPPEAGERLPLTGAQHGLWIGQQLEPANPAYNTAEYVEIDGPVDAGVFEAALRQTVAECEAVNMRFGVDQPGVDQPGGDAAGVDAAGPYQVLAPVTDWPLHVLDLAGADDPDAASRNWMLADLDRVVDLARGPLFAHALLRVGQQRYRWYHRVHHIALDGYGLALFARRVADVYTALLVGAQAGPTPFAPLGGVLAEEAAYRAGPRRAADRAYWLDRFADRPEPVALADSTAFAPGQAVRVVSDLNPDVVARLRGIARDTATTWPDVLIGAVAGYLHRMTGADEVILGLPVMNRLGTAGLRVPCTVVNVVPLRVRVDADAGIGELARRVAAEIRSGRPHHHYRYEDLQRDLKVLGGRRRLFGPAVNVMPFDYGLSFAGHRARVHNLSAGPVEDLSVAVYDRADGNGWRVVLGANPDRYSPQALRGHQEALLATLTAATAQPQRPVARACPVTPDAVLDGGPLPGPLRAVPDLVAEQACLRPDAVAVEHEGQALTFRQLVDRSRMAANALRARGIGPGDHVALLYPHGIDAVVAILAVLTAGAGYVPLDAKARRERRDHMLEVTGPVAVLTDDAGRQALDGCGVDLLDLAGLETTPEPVAPQEVPGWEAAAYVLFTSGSTGDPKAVTISHRALATYVAGALAVYRVGPQDRALHFLPLHFDGHVEEVLVSLCGGAAVVIRSEEMTRSLAGMVAGWQRHGTSVLNLPTAYWHEVVHGLDAGTVRMPGCVRTAIIGGEAAVPLRVRQWFDAVGTGIRLINTYGPTEATVVAVSVDLTAEVAADPGQGAVADFGDGSGVPIGVPFPGMRAVVVDRNGRLAAPGAVGELYLAGDALASGYLGRPDLDASRFPALAALPDRLRAYRTGDLVRRHSDGQLHFVGRADDEFKISGHRVDPGEVEAVLLACPGVARAAVVGRADATGVRHLAAFVVTDEASVRVGGSPGAGADGVAPTAAQLRAFLRERVPAALVPTLVEFLPELPRTATGKIDRVALRSRPSGGTRGDGGDRGDGDHRWDGLQRMVVEVWREVLGIPEIGPGDDFFDLGGQSLQTIQVANRISARTGREVTVATVFRHPTVAGLAADLAGEPGGGSAPGGGESVRQDLAARRFAQMLDDARLPEEIAPPLPSGDGPGRTAGDASPGWTPPGRILLTGATGFLGVNLLSALLTGTDDRVVCLVRDRTASLARQRLQAGLAAQGLPVARLADRVDVVRGDLARPGLGLGGEEFGQLARSCDAVYHNAAVISVMRGYGSLRATNVHGTRELLRLACVRGIPLHYLSTLNVAPPARFGAELPEDFLPAHPGLRDGYQQSKWAAERLVQQAGERGLPVSVYRLARLVGSPDGGYVNPQDLLWRVLRVGIPVGAIPRLFRADAWTPVDYVAPAVVHLSRSGRSADDAPAVYNLVPHPELPLTDLCAWINAYGYQVTLEPLARWRSLLPDPSADITTAAFFDLWSGGGEEDLEIGTVITAGADAGLAGTGIVCPPPDADLVGRYLDYCVRVGLLPAPGGDR